MTINLVVGNNGIITRATQAKVAMEEAEEKEMIELATISLQINNGNDEAKKKELERILEGQLGVGKVNTTANGDGSFLVVFTDSNRQYYMDKDYHVIGNSDIIKIATVEQLKKFRDEVNNQNTYEGKMLYLANDIALNNNEIWKPIGQYSDTDLENNREFKGIFDGKNYTISGLHVYNENERYQGLFGCNAGTIKNMIIAENGSIMGNGNTGAVVGYNKGTVNNCINKASVSSNRNNMGGVVGKNEGLVSKCKNQGLIQNSSQVTGGVVGWNCDNGIVEYCSNTGTVDTQDPRAGGVVGSNDGLIENCINNGKVSTSGYSITNTSQKVSTIGGIVGGNSAEVRNCYNTGLVEATYEDVGGIAGYSSPDAKVSNCYNIGIIKGANFIGGIAGYASAGIINCYYLDSTAAYGCNNSNSVKGIERQTAEYMISTEFLNKLNKDGNIFKIVSGLNNGYPVLDWE